MGNPLTGSIPDLNPVDAVKSLFSGGGSPPATPAPTPGTLYQGEAVSYLVNSFGLSKKEAQSIWDQWYAKHSVDPTGGHIGKDHAIASSSELDQFVGQVKNADPTKLKNDKEIQQATTKQQAAQAAGDTAGAAQLQQFIDSIGGKKVQTPQALAAALGGRDLTDAEVNNAISTYNAENPADRIKTRDDLYQRIGAGNIGALGAAMKNAENQVGGFKVFNIWDPGTGTMKKVQIDEGQFTALAAANTALLPNIASIIGEASRSGGQVKPGELAAAVRIMGLTAGVGPAMPLPSHNPLEGQLQGIGSAISAMTLSTATQSFKDMAAKYGDSTLALVALKDHGLADAIYNQGGATSDQALKVKQMIVDLGYKSVNDFVTGMAQQGVAIDENKLAAMVTPMGGTGGSGGGGGGSNAIQVTLPDPAKLGEAMRQLWRAWFQRDPNQQELDSFTAQVNGAITGKAQNLQSQVVAPNIFKGTPGSVPSQQVVTATDVDPQSRLIQQARQNPDYARLFNQKPAGMTEEEFAAQFKQAGTQFLGSAPDPSAVQEGMQTGSVNNTLGYIAGSQAAKDSSTFQDRLAQSAQAIARFT